MTYSWLTVHRVRFSEPRDLKTSGVPAGPGAAAAWRFGPDAPRGDNGLRTGVSDRWGGVGFFNDRADADDVVDRPEHHLPWLDTAAEHWHAVAGVIAHRGDVDWSSPGGTHPDLSPLADDPGGATAVITSAGYLSRDASQLPRITAFLEKVDHVIDHFGTLEANVARCLFNSPDTGDGMTFSVWRNDRDMLTSAYREGLHPQYLKQSQVEPMFDRSSFTRLRLVASSGTWDGIDPRAKATAAAAL